MGKTNKILASVVTIVVFGLLVFAGPAQAFEISLNIDNPTVEQGKKMEITATIDIGADENVPIDELELVLDGLVNESGYEPETVVCSFDITGKMKSGVNDACHGINIKKIPYPQIEKGYGYGYGYGYDFGYGYGYSGKLTYEITIHTQKFEVGKYQASFAAVIDGKTVSSDVTPIEITEKVKGNDKKSTEESSNENEGNGNEVNEETHQNNGNEKHTEESNNEDEEHESENEVNEDEEHENDQGNNAAETENNGNSNGKGSENSGNSKGNSGSNSGSSENNAGQGNGNSGNKGKNK